MTASASPQQTIAPGAHILARDAVWRVRQVNPTSSGGRSFDVIGISEIVRDQEAILIEEYETSVTVLDPTQTDLELDTSQGHRDSLLYMESLLRDVPPTSEHLHIGHTAAMDVMDFQLEPARTALSKTRQRILIADAVGLGKTLEAGILMSELIRRGRGKRILVVTVKSMLTQFQKEMWCRFSIPLVRLDSTGLHRIRERIPTNQNPFYHFDRTIISIDTLKQNNAFRTHVEKAHWDIIVIDEAHNVAVRGSGRSQRAKIAEVLADHSDALILLSATPHDGKARSFASLMNMLDPTAIANPDEYTKDDIQGLFVRRFKADVADQMGKDLPERVTAKATIQASAQEEAAYDALTSLDFTVLDGKRSAGMLYKTGLSKALFSSPIACAKTLLAPLKRDSVRSQLPSDFFPKRGTPDTRTPAQVLDAATAVLTGPLQSDIQQLATLAHRLAEIRPDAFSKYQKLLELITDKKNGFGWTPRKKDDRLVLFSERIETLHWLQEHLTADLKLKPDQIAVLHGGLSDTDQQELVEAFGNESSKLRVLLASDVASEGLNLHYLCHRLIHVDVPWSLMVFQQRNGRIDRYGQTRTPFVTYLLTQANNPDIAGDQRILDLLIERDRQAGQNIDDPSAFMGAYDVDKQELFTATLMENDATPTQAEALMTETAAVDLLAMLLSGDLHKAAPPQPKTPLSLFNSDFDYLTASLTRLRATEGVTWSQRQNEPLVELTLPPDTEESRRNRAAALDLRRRFRKLPTEVLPDDGVLVLTPDKDIMQQAISDARREESAWPRVQYLWPLNPVLEWCQDKGRAAFGRHTAPVLTLLDSIDPQDVWVIVSGLIPNRRSQPLIHRWYGVRFTGSVVAEVCDAADVFTRLNLGRSPLPNRNVPADMGALKQLIPAAVERTREAMVERCKQFEDRINPRLNKELEILEQLKGRQLEQLTLDLESRRSKRADADKNRRRIDAVFDHYLSWVQDSMTAEPEPFLQVIAVLRREPTGGAA